MRTPFREHINPRGISKIPYSSRAQALAYLLKHNIPGSVYQCDLCKQWHTSSQTHGR